MMMTFDPVDRRRHVSCYNFVIYYTQYTVVFMIFTIAEISVLRHVARTTGTHPWTSTPVPDPCQANYSPIDCPRGLSSVVFFDKPPPLLDDRFDNQTPLPSFVTPRPRTRKSKNFPVDHTT